MTDRVTFACNGRNVDVDVEPGESLLSVLRERLGIVSVKDGCAPQGQCGCCTVLVDGDARVACVTPARACRGPGGHDGRRARSPTVRDRFAAAFVETGGSQCGFCTPGIIMRAAAGAAAAVLDRALAAHLCRCTGWRTVYEAIERTRQSAAPRVTSAPRPRGRRSKVASRSASMPTSRSAAAASPTTPRRATRWSRCRSRRDPTAEIVEAAGLRWVVGESLLEARTAAGKVQGRRTTVDERAAVAVAAASGRRRAARDVVGRARVPRARRVVVRARRRARVAARERRRVRRQGALAARRRPRASSPTGSDAPVRVVYSREDVVRLGPKRPPIAATAVWRDGACRDRRRGRSRLRDPTRAPTRTAIASRRALARGRRRRSAGRLRAARARARRARACSSRARSTRPVSIARR